jgi:hypothetical protein
MFDPQAWLNDTLPDGQPRHRRLCFLVTANRGFSVGGWGIIAYGGGHQEGLDQGDALDLMQYSAFIHGLECAGVDFRSAFLPYLTAYQAELAGAAEKPEANNMLSVSGERGEPK